MTENPTPERPNIRHVASLAGVSHMTVSRVLNNHPNIKPDTRQRVLAVIEELNFRPNSAARALATQRNRRIGVLVEASSAYGPSTTLRGIELAAGLADYSVTSVSLHSERNGDTQAAVDQLTGQGIDALCIIAPRSSSLSALRELNPGVPVLAIKADNDANFLTTSLDQQQGAMLAVDHLAELGHRDILHLSGPLDWLDARARERAFHTRSRDWKLRERPIVVGDWSADFAYDYAISLKRRPDFTAIFSANDEMALGLVHGFASRGIGVPEEVSIVGFDDVPLAAHFLPPLTTVRQDLRQLGSKVVGALISAAEGREVPKRTKLPVELVVRESTAAPRRTS
ncbi:transcriptional regulator, LacI family [Tessaracoccus bendigoensis DSM 12906]|uniref:Transcriptional regulator, LacI family n=1 Tax=Tessaracoccus bendigoensis DSM 12906 TaxID=1123357 RepID=A0A1M6HTN2_9ACTN|nr:LacI family DNA-binding transcriptional regulator [Tessaracoccus bendigoensis]SHJ25551.1 transcriptional regulator, LacI family [Tessaracoccus bendigoensis DSM 12906]